MKQRCVVFIESNTTGTGRNFAKAAVSSGFLPIMVSANPARYPYLVEDRIMTLPADTSDLAAVTKCCESLAESYSIAGVTSSSEYYVATAASVAASLRLPGPRADAVRECRDKSQQCAILARAGVAVPDFQVARTVGEALDAAHHLGYPVVIKPLSGSGGVGVHLCADDSELEKTAASLLDNFVNERGIANSARVLLERCLEGPVYSVETLGEEVMGVTRKRPSSDRPFVACGHDFPGTRDSSVVGALASTTLGALRALRLGWGPAHTELCFTSEGPSIIEVNPRLAGAMIPELVRLATGRDLIAETIALATGSPEAPREVKHRYAAIRFILVPKDGKLIGVSGLESARSVPKVVSVEVYPSAGAALQIHGDFRDRIVHAIAVADELGAPGPIAEEALDCIALEIGPSQT